MADTDEEAEAVAGPACQQFYENIMKLWKDFGTVHVFFTPELSVARQLNVAIVGSPPSVQDQLTRLFGETGCNYPTPAFAWGNLSQQQSQRSPELFATKVMPAL